MTPPQANQAGVSELSARTLRRRVGAAYARQSREAMEEQWIIQYLPLVKHVVQKVVEPLRYNSDIDDLISAGTLGLVKAAKAFDPSRDANFKTYAYIRVRGAVIDELRSRSFVPAATISQLRRVQEAHQRLAASKGAPPSEEELAAELDIPVKELYRILQEARKSHFLSIHGITDEEDALTGLVPPDTAPGPDLEAQRRELSQRLAQAIRELSQRDRTVILLYYERDLTMKEAAEVLGVTESRVSQLHAGALFKLAMKLKEEQ